MLPSSGQIKGAHMSKSKNPKISGKNERYVVRSSAAEYLTFVAAGGGSEASVEMRYENENIWLTQKMMATLYDVSVPAINQHLKRVFADNELTREATVKQYLMVQTEGSREVRREVEHYSLQAIIAVGFKIENERAVQFRKWANQIVKNYTIQGWTMDVERLKRGGNLTDAFFERQLDKIREIRLSERKFYQKITDIYATALGLSDRKSFRERYLKPALADSLVEMTIPDKLNSRLQKYRLTDKSRQWLEQQRGK